MQRELANRSDSNSAGARSDMAAAGWRFWPPVPVPSPFAWAQPPGICAKYHHLHLGPGWTRPFRPGLDVQNAMQHKSYNSCFLEVLKGPKHECMYINVCSYSCVNVRKYNRMKSYGCATYNLTHGVMQCHAYALADPHAVFIPSRKHTQATIGHVCVLFSSNYCIL